MITIEAPKPVGLVREVRPVGSGLWKRGWYLADRRGPWEQLGVMGFVGVVGSVGTVGPVGQWAVGPVGPVGIAGGVVRGAPDPWSGVPRTRPPCATAAGAQAEGGCAAGRGLPLAPTTQPHPRAIALGPVRPTRPRPRYAGGRGPRRCVEASAVARRGVSGKGWWC